MAVTATFKADFSSFTDAVKKAEVTLVSFETGAAKVERQLSRMTDGFSGRRVIQEATLMARAVEDAGGVSNLTANELKRVGATAQEAADKMRALGLDVPKGIQSLADAAKNAEGGTSKLDLSFGKLVGSYVTGQAALNALNASFRAVTGFMLDTVKSASSAEAAQNKLNAALRQQGTFTPEVVSQFNDLATQMQKTTIYSDDLTNEMQALLVQVGGVMPSAMGRAQQAAADLASGLGIDLQTATTLVAKAAAGHTETLGKYGIQVSQAELQTKGFSAVLDAVNRQFGGQASAQLDTYTGKVAQLGNAWDNVKEAIGRRIVFDPVILATITKLTEESDAAADAIDNGTESTSLWSRALSTLGTTTRDVVLSQLPGVRFIAEAWQSAEEEAAKYNAIVAAGKRGEQNRTNLANGARDTTFDRIAAAAAKEAADQAKKDEEATKRAAEAAKKAAEEYRVWAQAVKEVMQTSQGLGFVLAGIDGKVLEGVKYYREQGVSLDRLATMYGLSKVQVEALQQAEEDETATLRRSLQADEAAAAALAKLTKVRRESFTVLDEAPQRQIIDPARLATLNKAKPLGLGAMFGSDVKNFFDSGDFTKIMVQGITGGGGVKGGLEASASSLGASFTKDWGERITKNLGGTFGKALGGLIGPLGTLAGPLIDKAIGAIGKLFGNNEEKKINPIRQQFVDAAGGLDELNKKAVGAGTTLRAMLDAKTPEAYKKAIEDLNAAFDFQAKAMQTLEETAKKYGLTLEELGPAFSRQQLEKQAGELYQDFKVLTGAGVDLDVVLGHMGDSVNEFVHNALKTGTEIPAALAPVLQRMVELGQLTDENGNVITDLGESGVKFSMTMSEGFKSVVESVKKLTDAIARGLGLSLDDAASAADDLASSLGKIPSDKTIKVHTQVDTGIIDPTFPSDVIPGAAAGGRVTSFGVQHFGRGGFVPRGTDTVPAMLTPGELILNAAQQRGVSNAIAGSGGSSRPYVIQLEGRDIAYGIMPYFREAAQAHGVTR